MLLKVLKLEAESLKSICSGIFAEIVKIDQRNLHAGIGKDLRSQNGCEQSFGERKTGGNRWIIGSEWGR